MTLSEITARFGSAALARFAALILAFLLLQLLRVPFAALVWLLTAGMRWLDRAACTRITTTTPPPTRRAWPKGATA